MTSERSTPTSTAFRRATPLVIVLGLTSCRSCSSQPSVANETSTLAPPPAGHRAPPPNRPPTAPLDPAIQAAPVKLAIFDKGLAPGWQDWGWGKHEITAGAAARIDMSKWGGFILAHPGLNGDFSALSFRYKAPQSFGEFLEVRLHSDPNKDKFPHVRIGPDHHRPADDGWIEITLPLTTLNPNELPFDRIIFFAHKNVSSEPVLFDAIALHAPVARTTPPPAIAAPMTVACSAKTTPISPYIYGTALGDGPHVYAMGTTARRWGGNSTTRYNPELGDAWNTANDWFFQNVKGRSAADFLAENRAHRVKSALSVPMIGWVAKDKTSFSFPISIFGPQAGRDGWRPDSGNGMSPDNKPIAPGPPTRTSVPAPPSMIKRWIETIRREDQKRGERSVHLYILDNEPMLWNTTHRDVHPEPLGYDELLERTIQYGTAIREADPDALIAGPAFWGWPAYLFSAKDASRGFTFKPDRRAHGDLPLVEWYLRKLREHEQKTGVRILDVLDLHLYPQADRVHTKDGTDRNTSALRIRSTRALWDPSYTDESWINDKVMLIPRMKEWIAKNYPGRGMSIGEYNFGAEEHMSGALALAEALGRFGQGGLSYAFYWTFPPDKSPAYWAFRAYRDFDGHGGRFLDLSIPTTAKEGTSLFASRDNEGKHIVLIALNLDRDTAAQAKIVLSACAPVVKSASFVYTGERNGFAPGQPVESDSKSISTTLPPYSITILDLHLHEAD